MQCVDSLRGIAACGVMINHFAAHGGLFADDTAFGNAIRAATAWGSLGVPVFFVISGFVLPYSMHHAGYRLSDFRQFVAKRILRLEPTYLVSIAVHVTLWVAASRVASFRGEPFVFDAGQFAAHGGYLCDLLGYRWYLQNYWTLALEFQFYLAMALVFPWLDRLRPTGRAALLAAFLAADLCGPKMALFTRWGGLFATGIATYFLRDARRRVPLDWWVLAACIATVACRREWPVALAAAATACVIFRDDLPRLRPLVFLGSISYSLYLFHTIVGERFLHLVERFCRGDAARVVALVAAMAVSIAAAWGVCLLVEWPSQRLAARLRYRSAGRTIAQPVVRSA